MSTQIKDCIVCHGTARYYRSRSRKSIVIRCPYCQEGKTEVTTPTHFQHYIAAGPGFTISEGQVSAGNLSIEYALSNSATIASRPKKTREQVHPENSGAWAVMWANALDN